MTSPQPAEKPQVLALTALPPPLVKALQENFALSQLDTKNSANWLAKHGKQFTGAVTHAGAGISAEIVKALPQLKVVSSLGVGFDQLDEDALSQRKIQVGYTPEVLNGCVADLAFALLLDVARGVSAADRFVRKKHWLQENFALQHRVHGKRLGILGMGRIGEVIARRASGFDMQIGYHNRSQLSDTPYTYFSSATNLAEWADYFIIAVTGGPATQHLVNTEVLQALGANGFLINISRGSVVDENALIKALSAGTIAGAALDVYTNEPNVPDALLSLNNVVLTPHIASGTQETRQAMAQLVIDNLKAYYETGKVLQAVPWANY